MKGLEKIRNIGIIAHIDAGKTTTTERLIYYSGREHRHGDVDSGNTVTDYDEEEASRGITIYSATTAITWRDSTINIIDTPGHVDFTAEVERSLRVLDGAVCVLDGVAGVQAQTETVWRQADRYEVPRVVFVNKLDRAGADFDYVLGTVRDRLGGNPIPITLPDVCGGEFRRVLDVLTGEWVSFSEADDGKTVEREPATGEDAERASEARGAIVEALADHHASDDVDTLVEAHLEGREIDVQLLKKALREATLTRAVMPALSGSSLRNRGVQPVMDAILDYLPSPLDRPPQPGVHPKTGEELTRDCKPKAPFAALAFKTIAQTTVDHTFIRVYSGSLKGRVQVLNPGQKKTERIGPKFHRMHGQKLEELDQLKCGDIAVLQGLKWTVTGDTICDKDHPILFESIGFPETVISMTIEPQSTAEKDKLDQALAKLSRDDPTFRVKEDTDTGELVVSGMGELHLEIIKNRLQRDFNVEARFGRPRVSYRETFDSPVSAKGEFEQVMGEEKRLYAHIEIDVKPTRGTKTVTASFADEVSPMAVPKDFRAAVMDSLVGRAAAGHLLGYPLIDLEVTVTGGGRGETDANEATYSAAASMAFSRACEKLAERDGVRILEPIMKIEVSTPEQFLGNVIHDLNSRRAEITDMSGDGDLRKVEGKVPLSLMFNYSSDLRSMSQGLADYAMEPLDYAPLPADKQAEMLGGYV